ncbi:MAG TPA: hypothetical protein PKU82_11060 [Bacteroidia bacterium]|nr:hypothetical protein [Bacteroidia bacterium]
MKIIFFLLQIDTTNVATLKVSNSIWTSWWFWIAVLEFAIIILLLMRKKQNSNLAFSDLKKNTIKNSKKADIDMDNLMQSIHGSGELYKELSRRCHPDRFVNSPKQKIAEEIFQEISNNRRDFEKLSLLKQRAIDELNINF